MSQHYEKIKWAPRVRPERIARLYEKDAQGIQDFELCEDVGLGLYLRCQTILRALRNEVECPRCGAVFRMPVTPDNKPVYCPANTCGWQTTGIDYKTSWSKRRIWAGKAVTVFETFYSAYPGARTYQAKIVLIDTLLHSFHWDLKLNKPNRSAANNLIEGNHDQVITFLDNLSGGNAERKQAWRETVRTMMQRRKGL